uniref:Uncharacterized protein LOC110222127 n=1 Tax=Phascolarctos cinereus TaxID=38626 RepID=A0A6P5M330_PHACI|nr:uncharacterized protein LOC110222127 [Phascolarctos cinereus]
MEAVCGLSSLGWLPSLPYPQLHRTMRFRDRRNHSAHLAGPHHFTDEDSKAKKGPFHWDTIVTANTQLSRIPSLRVLSRPLAHSLRLIPAPSPTLPFYPALCVALRSSSAPLPAPLSEVFVQSEPRVRPLRGRKKQRKGSPWPGPVQGLVTQCQVMRDVITSACARGGVCARAPADGEGAGAAVGAGSGGGAEPGRGVARAGPGGPGETRREGTGREAGGGTGARPGREHGAPALGPFRAGEPESPAAPLGAPRQGWPAPRFESLRGWRPGTWGSRAQKRARAPDLTQPPHSTEEETEAARGDAA